MQCAAGRYTDNRRDGQEYDPENPGFEGYQKELNRERQEKKDTIMLEIEHKTYLFKTKTIWFSEAPFDVGGYDGVIFHACTEDVDMEGFSKRMFSTLEIDLTQDLDTIWNKMGKSSCRRSIKIATNEGVIIRVNQGYDTFYTLNSEFRKEKGLPEYNVDIEFMKKHGVLILAEYDGEVLGGNFFICGSKKIRGLIAASKRLEQTGSMRMMIGHANRLMEWETIKYAKKMGMDTFDQGGYYTGETPDPQMERINQYKRSFGGELATHYIYQKDYSKIYSLARWGYVQLKSLSL